MDLKTFVTETLTQIADGVKAAQEQQNDLGAIFSPKNSIDNGKMARNIELERMTQNPDYRPLDQLELIEFDVALTISDNVHGGVKAGIEVMGVSLAGAKGDISHQNETVSRVKFSIVVRWPRCD